MVLDLLAILGVGVVIEGFVVARALWLLVAEVQLWRVQQVEAWRQQGIGVWEPMPSPYWSRVGRRAGAAGAATDA